VPDDFDDFSAFRENVEAASQHASSTNKVSDDVTNSAFQVKEKTLTHIFQRSLCGPNSHLALINLLREALSLSG